MASRLLHFDGAAGISGDMALGALLDCGASLPRVLEGLTALGLPHWSLEVERRPFGGLVATRARVVLAGADNAHVVPPSDHDHGHAHAHGDRQHGHGHDAGTDGRTWPAIAAVIEAAPLPTRARQAALATFRRLCEVEAELHGVALERAHLHEVGATDALIDTCGVALALEDLGWPDVSCSPPDVGGGTVRCAHGLLPVPAPATARLLEGFPVTASGALVELTTPTGAALLATLSTRWGPLPSMNIERTGYGAGERTLPDRPNVLRATLGTPLAASASGESDERVVLETDIDDADPQMLASFCQLALELGASDATQSPIVMKKGRTGVRLSVVAPDSCQDAILAALFAGTTTIGCRITRVERATCARETVSVPTPFGDVRVKLARWNGRVVNRKPEHDDCAARASASGVSIKDVAVAAAFAALERHPPE